jgi:hypothetical protein
MLGADAGDRGLEGKLMTIIRRDGLDSPFNAWIRRQPQLDSREYQIAVTDADLWVHRYSSRNERGRHDATDIRQVQDHIMLVEVKSFHKKVSFAQRDTLDLIDAILRKATVINGKRRPIMIPDSRRPGASRQVRWLGKHVLELENDSPDNSTTIYWDGKGLLNEQQLIEILRFDRDPDYPSNRLDTRRHHIVIPRATLGSLPLKIQ